MNLMEMKLINILLIGLALTANVNCRAIDDDENDNVIQQQNDNEQQEPQDWVKITKPPVAKLINTMGSQIQLECEVMGSPSPSIQWIDGNVEISERDTYATNVLSESSTSAIIKVRSILIVDNNEMHKENQYTCIGQAGGKYVSAVTTIINNPNQKTKQQIKNISDLLQLNKKKPKIVYSYTMYLELTGSNIVLPCRINNNIRTELYWMDNNNQIIGGTDMNISKNQRMKVLPTGELLITDLKWSDMGAYKCVAKNPYGKDHADTFVYPAMREDA